VIGEDTDDSATVTKDSEFSNSEGGGSTSNENRIE